MSYSNIKRLSQLLCLYLLMCLPAQAQDQIEEVIVSASFRDSTLRTAPASITVMNQQTIGQRGAQHIDELLGRAANVNITGGASRGKFVQVRGIGDIEQFKDPKHYPAVGLMIDELDMSNLGTAGTLFDIEQVEILRGPQGTRFGSAALGGMIKLKSAAPSDSFEGKVVAGISDYNGTELGAALGGPISDTLSGRLAVHQYKSDGYKDNTFLNKDDTNGFDEQVVRARLKWQASGDGEFDLNIFYLDVDNGYDAFSLNNSRFETRSDQPGRDKQNTLAASLTNRLLLKDQLLLETTLTAKDVELEYSFDEDWDNSQLCVISSCPFGGWDSFDLYLRDRQEQSLDVRLVSQHQLNNSGDWRWLLGFYHQRRTEELSRGQVNPFLSDYDIDRSAIYGQVEVQLSDNLTMTTGLRGESFEDDYQDNLPSQLDSEDSLWAGEISFNYAMNDSSQLYVTVSRGYKAGGINTDANADYSLLSDLFQDHIGSRLGFDQETLVNWELGVKSLALDGSLAINAAVFYMNRSDAQLETWLYDAATFSWVGYLDNANATTYGLEIETQYQISETLSLYANIGLLKTELDDLAVFDLDSSQFKNLEKRAVARAPEYQYSLGGNFQFSPALSLNITFEGRDDYYYAYYHNSKAGSTNLINANLSYQSDDWHLNLWGRNLTNQTQEIHGLYFAADPRDGWSNNRSHVQFSEPRVYGFTASYDF